MSLLKRFFTLTILKCWRNQRYFLAIRTVGQWSRDNTKKNIPTCKYVASFNFPKMFLSFFLSQEIKNGDQAKRFDRRTRKMQTERSSTFQN